MAIARTERTTVVIELIDILFVSVVLAAFVIGLRTGIATLIVIRPLTDRLFQLASIDVAGHHMTYAVTMNLVIICATMLNIFRIRRCAPSGLRNIWLPFLLVCAAGVLYSPLPFDALRKLGIYVSYYGVFALSFVIVRSERDVQFFLKLVILSSVLPVLYGLFQILSGVDWYDDSRIHSTFSHPNMFAFYLLAVIGVILFLTTNERIRLTRRLRLLLNLYFIPLLIVLIVTKTRSAWIGCFFLFFVYGLAYDRRVLALTVIAAPLALAIPEVNERVIQIMSHNEYAGGRAVDLNSYAWRVLLWETAFPYIWRQPIFGYGLHSFPFYSAEFFYPTPNGTYAHNDYIQVLFETGLVGLITFLWIFWRCFVWLFQRWRFDNGGVTTAAAIMVTYLICSFSDNLLEYLPYQWEFWFPFGVICWHIAQDAIPAGNLGYRSQSTSWSRLTRTRARLAVGTPTRGRRG